MSTSCSGELTNQYAVNWTCSQFSSRMVSELWHSNSNSLIPNFLKWTIPVLNLYMSTGANRGASQKAKLKTMPNSVDNYETAVHCLQLFVLVCSDERIDP